MTPEPLTADDPMPAPRTQTCGCNPLSNHICVQPINDWRARQLDAARARIAEVERERDEAVARMENAQQEGVRIARFHSQRADAAETALAEARVVLANLRGRFGAPIDYGDPTYEILKAADAVLARGGPANG